jgi:2-keto-4-pentenoate hydratase/2-oxohepta-3-ene-1,7-dioic acid hydratase in catechol pathway
MRIVVFGPRQRVGALVGEQVIDLNRALARRHAEGIADVRLPAQLEAFISAGPAAMEDARRVVSDAAALGSDPHLVHKLTDVKLHAPWPGRRVACAGGNFAEHLRGMESDPNITLEEVASRARERGQWGFWKVPDMVPGPGGAIPFPKRTRYLDYEGEAAIIIGKHGKDIPASKLDEYVWGITLLNDWSIRDGSAPARPMNYNLAKNFDGSTSMGPCIVVDELQPGDVPVETRVNGDLRQRYNTSEMIWSFGEILELLSEDFTFVPGDVISGGTNAGTAADKSKKGPDGAKPLDLFLKPGDVVEVSSSSIGILRNNIV